MARKYLMLNSALLFWLLALLCWSLSAAFPATLFGALSLLTFITHFLLHQVNTMFKKKIAEEISPQLVTPPLPAPVAPADKEPSGAEKQGTTVIARDVCFEGNIVAGGHVYIHGTLKGNIEASDNLIRVMRGGVVEGNIQCRELIIDGAVNGQCASESAEICEHGTLNGTLRYRTLAVKKGGVFCGQAEMMPPQAEPTNVVGLIKETADVAPEANPQAKKSQHAAG